MQLINGKPMPTLGLGTWKSRPGEVRFAVREAIRAGCRHIDCATIYGNEVEVGQGLADAMADGVGRDELWITSKLWNDAHAPADVRPALEASLSKLGLEQLDLYLMHWPVAIRGNASFPLRAHDIFAPGAMPVATTWQAMEACVDAGLVRHVGVSNFSARKLQQLLDVARIAPAMNQVELHPYLQQDALLRFCATHGVGVTAYSPLGSGDRPKGMKTAGEPVLLQDPVILALADKHGASAAQILIAWALQRGTSVIPKSVNAGRIAQNLAAAKIVLDADDMRQLAALDCHRRYLDGADWVVDGGPFTQASLWDE
ncbi:MAG TPA: aldo/keto reductase [Rhodanobacteraceae bacterium]